MKSFKQFNEEKKREVVFTFGRFNPPTIGHGKLIAKVAAAAIGNDYRIYASQSSDAKKNPLEYKEKIKVMRKMFPNHGRNIIEDKNAKTALHIASILHDQGFTKITMVVGSDRIKEFQKLLTQYNGAKGRHGYYDFKDGIDVISAGERDPDAEGVSGMSASKMRQAAMDGDFKSFMLGVPKGYGKGMTLFNLLRKRMGLKEKKNFREHIELPPLSDKREKYIAGEIFNVGDKAYVGEVQITIKERKSNFIICDKGDKYFIDSLTEKRQRQDKDVAKRPGTQPAPYYDKPGKKLSKSTKANRARHFEKGAKKDDDDPSAYKPAPGDARAKTKLSKHTIAYRKKFGEFVEDDHQGPCWKTHKMVGMKKKKGYPGLVPNCVPREEAEVDEAKRMKYNKVIKKLKDGEWDTSMDVKKRMHLTYIDNNSGKQKVVFVEADKRTPRKKGQHKGSSSHSDLYTDEDPKGTIHGLGFKDAATAKKGIAIINKSDRKHAHKVQATLVMQQRAKVAMGRTKDSEKKANIKAAYEIWTAHLEKLKKITKQKNENASCPVATQDLAVNTKNRDATIKNYNYGPLNVDEPGDYWKDIAKYWKTTEAAAKKSLCENCVAFDISPRMKDCMPGKTSDEDGVLGYCWMHHFKCHSARSCHTWAKGGPIEDDKTSLDWGKRAGLNEYLEFGTDKLANKYKKDTPGEVEEGEGKYKGEKWADGFKRRVVKTTKPEHLEKGFKWRIKGKERNEISIKLYKKKPDYKEFVKQMKRVAGHEFGG